MRASLIRCCLALLGLCLWQPLYAGEPLALRVMTFNLMCPVCGWSDYGRWGLRQGGLIASLREGQPDLLSTQEMITPGNLEVVREALPRLDPYYLERGVPLLDAVLWVDRERFEVLAKGGFWVSDTPDAAIGFNETLSVPRVVIWLRLRDRPTGTTFVLVGLHLDNNRHNKPPAVTLLRERLPQLGALPLIVAGDFNAIPGSAPMLRMAEFLRDAWPVVGNGPGFTIPVRKPTRRIDYIWHTPGALTPVSALVISTEASDHLPVVVEFRLN